LPGVDPDQIGITGISWGGIITSLMAGMDKRLNFLKENEIMTSKNLIRRTFYSAFIIVSLLMVATACGKASINSTPDLYSRSNRGQRFDSLAVTYEHGSFGTNILKKLDNHVTMR
jgi:hypothetical protein